jgi:hypothetical protein
MASSREEALVVGILDGLGNRFDQKPGTSWAQLCDHIL